MGLDSRDWWIEGMDRRYSQEPIKKSKQKKEYKSKTIVNPNFPLEVLEKGLKSCSLDSDEYYTQQVVCKNCLKILNVKFPKKKPKINLGRVYICPNCNNRNYIDRWRSFLFELAIIIGLFFLFVLCLVIYSLYII